jgi:hypothetical protein
MNTYKNLALYQLAFNLSVKVYRMNVTLPATALLHQGNKLRWTSLKIKDLIAEGFSGIASPELSDKNLESVVRLSREAAILLKGIHPSQSQRKLVNDLAEGYVQLGRKAEEHRKTFQTEKTEYRIRFPESFLMDKAG